MLGALLLAAVMAGQPARFIGNPAALVTPADYPPDALGAHAEGQAVVALDVDPAGQPKACRIAATSGNASLDRATCALVRARARFQPGTGTDGRPVAATVLAMFRWSMKDCARRGG